MQRRRRKAVLRKPTANRAQERPVMKIQMRPVGEKLDSDVSRFPYRFQEINRHRPASMDLRRDSELHEGIVQERNVMIGGYVCPYLAAGSARLVPAHDCHGSAGHAAVHNTGRRSTRNMNARWRGLLLR